MRRVTRVFAAAAVAGSVALAGPGMAAQAAPPSVPAGVVVTPVADAHRAGSVDVAWLPASDSDGAAAGYVVRTGPEGGALTEQVVVAPGARIGSVVRGVAWRVEVAALDDAGERSPFAVAAPFRLPALAVEIRAGVRVPGAQSRGCPGARRPCTVTSARGAVLELRGPAAAAPVRGIVEASWRRPGSRSFARRSRFAFRVGADGGGRIALGSRLRASGTWCLRLLPAATTDLAVRVGPPTCVRLRPPVEIGWAGDIVVGSHYGLPPNGGRAQFSGVQALLRRPDLMIGNYEGTLSRGGSPRCSGGALCYIFQAPPERARNLAAAGFDAMNLANNHGLDMGEGARRQTVSALERVGVAAAGLPGRVTVLQVEDTRVAIVGFSPYPGTTSMRDPAAIRALVREARRRGDVVVAAFHAGLEGAAGAHVPHGADYGTNTRAAVHAAVDAGADLVLGSGPHVVRGIERYRGAYIVYSVGNFAGWHNFATGGLTAQSGVVRFTVDHSGRAAGGTWDAVRLTGPGIPVRDRTGAITRRVAQLSRADFGSAGARFGRGGRFR